MQFYLKPLAAILTFLIGTFAVYLAPLPNIQVAHDARYDEVYSAPETVSLCELEKHPELYDGKIIRMRAWIEMDDNALIFDHQLCGTEPVRVSCRAGYTSCLDLLEDLRFSRTGRAQIYADGRFHAAVLEHHSTCRADSLVPLFEIAETRGLKLEGVRQAVYDDKSKFKLDSAPCENDARPCDRGTGTGIGHGTGYGNGGGSGRGIGYGSGDGSGGSHPPGTGSGSGDGIH